MEGLDYVIKTGANGRRAKSISGMQCFFLRVHFFSTLEVPVKDHSIELRLTVFFTLLASHSMRLDLERGTTGNKLVRQRG